MTTPVFDLQKSIQAILYVANRLNRKDFHKIFKILYFADRNHLSDYGRTITGDFYVAMDDGPVPSKIYDIFKIVRGDGLFSAEKKSEFDSYFNVQNWMFIVPKKMLIWTFFLPAILRNSITLSHCTGLCHGMKYGRSLMTLHGAAQSRIMQLI